jgi:hypothetical protein
MIEMVIVIQLLRIFMVYYLINKSIIISSQLNATVPFEM